MMQHSVARNKNQKHFQCFLGFFWWYSTTQTVIYPTIHPSIQSNAKALKNQRKKLFVYVCVVCVCVWIQTIHSNMERKFNEGKKREKKISNSYYLHMNAPMETEDVLPLHTHTHTDTANIQNTGTHRDIWSFSSI